LANSTMRLLLAHCRIPGAYRVTVITLLNPTSVDG